MTSPELSIHIGHESGNAGQLTPVWRTALIRLAIVWSSLILAFLPDWTAMAGQWWNSSTYNHILLVPFILVWLVMQRVEVVLRFRPEAWWPGLFLVAAAVFCWVLGALAGLNLARDIGAVGALIAVVPTLLGVRAGMALAFPLAYMALLVPFGDELIPPLQMITATITIGLTRLSAIPAVIDGVFIDTPAGLFEVAEACSGVKFLVAMVAFGLLVANVCFLSWRRRINFMVVCVIVPIVANGIRAWGTIYAAQFFGVEVAAGFDHIIYGWVFFAIVIAIVLAMAWRYFDRDAAAPMADTAAIAASPILEKWSRFKLAPLAALAAICLLVAGGHGWARAVERLVAPMPQRIDLPVVTGWQHVDYQPKIWWEPRASGADHRLLGSYRDSKGHKVDVFIALYASQAEGKEAGGYGEGALRPESNWNWLSPGPELSGGKSDRLLADAKVARMAVTWYRSGDLLTGSNASLKLANIRDRLLLRERPTMMLIISAEEGSQPGAEQSIAAFVKATGPIGYWMDRIAAMQ